MGVKKRFTLDAVGGGLNQGLHPTDIADSEMSTLRNWHPSGTRLRRRRGLSRITPASLVYSEALTNAFAYKTGTGQWTLILGALTSIAKLDGNQIIEIPDSTGRSYTSDKRPWAFRQYKDVVYATRPNAGTLQRITTFRQDAGIAAPTTAPTIADGGAGNLVAGDYIGVVTFYNTATGAESNPSPNTSTLTLAGSRQIAWSNIPTSSNAQVDARRLYRTLADQQGVYFFVGQINDNIATTFTDNVVQDDMGAQASFDNGVPPAKVEILEIWQERAWLSDGTNVYFSQLGLPESYSEFDVLAINPDDGHKVRGLLAFGDRLLVGKTNAVYYVTTIDGFSFRISALTNVHGVFSHNSMRTAEGFAFWYGGDNFYQTDGNTVRAIGDLKIRTFLDAVPDSEKDKVVSVIDESKNLYLSVFPDSGKVTAFNYRTDAWTLYDFRAADNSLTSPLFMADFFDSSGQPVIYCNLQGGDEAALFQFDSGNTDDGRPIECELVTKYFGFTEDQRAKIIGDIELQATPVSEVIDISVLGDDAQALAGPTSINLSGSSLWFRIPLATNGRPAQALAVKLEYQGTRPVDILGLAFAITDLERRVPVSQAV